MESTSTRLSRCSTTSALYRLRPSRLVRKSSRTASSSAEQYSLSMRSTLLRGGEVISTHSANSRTVISWCARRRADEEDEERDDLRLVEAPEKLLPSKSSCAMRRSTMTLGFGHSIPTASPGFHEGKSASSSMHITSLSPSSSGVASVARSPSRRWIRGRCALSV